MLDLDTDEAVVGDDCPFLNLTITHTIIMLIVRITTTSPESDATTGKRNAESRGLLIVVDIRNESEVIVVVVTVSVTVDVSSVLAVGTVMTLHSVVKL